jgi:hypothetical protein
MSNNTYRNLPSNKVPSQYFTTTNALAADIKNYPRTTTVADNTAAEDILADSVWRIDAQDHQNEGMPAKKVRNLGTAGPILNCTSGSTSVADSNDPKFLDWIGTNYVYLPGVAGNYLTVPDENAFDITGDIDIRVQVALDDWTPAAIAYVLGKSTAVQYSYVLQVNTSGTLSLLWSPDGGTTVITKTSTVAPTIGDGQPLWIRGTLDVNNGASGYDVQFFTSTNGTTWTQLGTTVTTAGTTSIFSGTAEIRIGRGASGTQLMIGKHYRSQILDGINGTTVLDVDTSVITSGGATSFTAGTGQTVTIERATSGLKTVAVTTPVWLFGTDDSLSVPGSSTGSKAVDFSNNDSFTALVVMRQWNTNTTFRGILSKLQNAGSALLGYYIWTNSPSTNFAFAFNDGVNSASRSSAFTNGVACLFGGIANRYRNSLQVTASTGILSAESLPSNISNMTNTGTLAVGGRSSGSSFVDMEFIAAAIWRRPLSQDEISTVRTYYLDRWK